MNFLKIKTTLAFVLILFSMSVNAQRELDLEGYVSGYKGKVKLILNPISFNHETDMVNEDVVDMIDGKFRVIKKLEGPTLLSIRIRPEIGEDFDPELFESAFIWVDNRTMTLRGEKGSFEFCDVTGYSRQDDYEKSKDYVRTRLLAHRKTIDSLSSLNSTEGLKQAEHLKRVSEIYLENKYKLEYSYLHPNRFISVYDYSWFVTWIPEMVPKSHAISFYDLLDDSLKSTIPGRQIKYYIDHIAVNKRLNVGDSPYDFTLSDSSAMAVTFSSVQTKVILLDFWASGCSPCRKEHANYAELYERYNGKGLEIISVSQDKNRDRWVNSMKKDRISWISLWDQDRSISKYAYLVSGIPDNYLINKNGIIVANAIYGEELQKAVEELLEE